MLLLFKLIILTSIIVLALKVVLSEGMLLEKLGNWLEDKVKDKYEDGKLIKKGNKFYDLFICAWCMNSLQSITAHAFAFGLGILPLEFNWQLLIRWPLVIMGASLLSGNLWNLYETVNRIKDKNETENIFLDNATGTAIAITDSIYAEHEEDEEYEEHFNHQHN